MRGLLQRLSLSPSLLNSFPCCWSVFLSLSSPALLFLLHTSSHSLFSFSMWLDVLSSCSCPSFLSSFLFSSRCTYTGDHLPPIESEALKDRRILLSYTQRFLARLHVTDRLYSLDNLSFCLSSLYLFVYVEKLETRVFLSGAVVCTSRRERMEGRRERQNRR